VHAIKRRKPKRVVVAVPIAPAETIKKLTQEADEVVCLDTEVVPENRTCC